MESVRLYGTVTDQNGVGLSQVQVEVKNEHFETQYSAQTDSLGRYELSLPSGYYPFVTAVRDYAKKYLEFWCHDLRLNEESFELNAAIGQIEIYGLHVFQVRGAANGLMLYFRPMSLAKFLQFGQEMTDICPELGRIRVLVDEKEAENWSLNQVYEKAGDLSMSAYLLHVSNPNPDRTWHKVRLQFFDQEGHFGEALACRNDS